MSLLDKQHGGLVQGGSSETKTVQLRRIPDNNWGVATDILTETGRHESLCVLDYEVGTTGYRHKDSVTYLRLKADGCTNIQILPGDDSVEIILNMDDELRAIKHALRFFLRVLDRESGEEECPTCRAVRELHEDAVREEDEKVQRAMRQRRKQRDDEDIEL